MRGPGQASRVVSETAGLTVPCCDGQAANACTSTIRCIQRSTCLPSMSKDIPLSYVISGDIATISFQYRFALLWT